MRVLLIALLAAISYAQTEYAPTKSISSSPSISVERFFYETIPNNQLEQSYTESAEEEEDEFGFQVSRDFLILMVVAICLCAIGNACACYVVHSRYQGQILKQNRQIQILLKKRKEQDLQSSRISESISQRTPHLNLSLVGDNISDSSQMMSTTSCSSHNQTASPISRSNQTSESPYSCSIPMQLGDNNQESLGSVGDMNMTKQYTPEVPMKKKSSSGIAINRNQSKEILPAPLNIGGKKSNFQKSHSAPPAPPKLKTFQINDTIPFAKSGSPHATKRRRKRNKKKKGRPHMHQTYSPLSYNFVKSKTWPRSKSSILQHNYAPSRTAGTKVPGGVYEIVSHPSTPIFTQPNRVIIPIPENNTGFPHQFKKQGSHGRIFQSSSSGKFTKSSSRGHSNGKIKKGRKNKNNKSKSAGISGGIHHNMTLKYNKQNGSALTIFE